jgi:hypothetical protein
MRFAALFGPSVSPAFPVLEPKAEDAASCPGPLLKRPGNGLLANCPRVQLSAPSSSNPRSRRNPAC